MVEVSALSGAGLSQLVLVLQLLSDLLSPFLRPPSTSDRAECTVIEADQAPGLGRTLRVLVHWGHLRPDLWFLTERHLGRVRALLDDQHQSRPQALPGYPISVAGLKGDQLPPPGAGLFAMSREEAERLQELRQLMVEFKFKEMHGLLYLPEEAGKEEAEEEEEVGREDGAVEGGSAPPQEVRISKHVKLVYVPRRKKWRRVYEEQAPSLPLVLKADQQGRLETLLTLLEDLAAEEGGEGPPMVVEVIASGVGPVTQTDLFHAQVEVEENGHPFVPIFCFGAVGLDPAAQTWLAARPALQPHLPVRTHAVIYDLVREVRFALEEAARRRNEPQEMKVKRVPRKRGVRRDTAKGRARAAKRDGRKEEL